MRQPNFRYLLASRPDSALRALLSALRVPTGQRIAPVPGALLHLTWFTFAETDERARFLAPRVAAALAGEPLVSGQLWFGRVRGGASGAAVHSRGPKPEALALYEALAARLSARGLPPLHRRSGFHPHITLGYAPCRFAPFTILHPWAPAELLLIESEIGRTRHNILARWPLAPPRQGALPFDAPRSWRAAA